MSPIYEYYCPACGKDYEVIASSTDTLTCVCCGTDDVVKKISFHAGYSISGDNSASTGTPRQIKKE